MSNDAIEARMETLEHCHEQCSGRTATALSYMKWFGGVSMTAFLVVAGAAYVKADRAGAEMSTQAQVRFAQQEERYKSIQKDLHALDKKIDERFKQISKTLDEMKGPK
jgi:peptidoglycan hydrolase CwlO-like protein